MPPDGMDDEELGLKEKRIRRKMWIAGPTASSSTTCIMILSKELLDSHPEKRETRRLGIQQRTELRDGQKADYDAGT